MISKPSRKPPIPEPLKKKVDVNPIDNVVLPDEWMDSGNSGNNIKNLKKL